MEKIFDSIKDYSIAFQNLLFVLADPEISSDVKEELAKEFENLCYLSRKYQEGI